MRTVVLCKFSELESGAARRVVVDGHKIALVRIDQDVYAIGDTCSHADFSLAEGDVEVEDKTLECWKHGSMFSLETGEPQCLPAIGAVPTYEIEISDDEVTVKLP